jgi:tRNA (guanine37-N1)-methyltransferase
MRIACLTLFPEYFEGPLTTGLMAKGRERGLLDVELVNPRDFTTDVHRTVDDRPFGGGPGMVMMLDPVAKALESIGDPGRILVMSPAGRPFDQAMARELADQQRLTFVCGRYEGVDARLAELYPVEEVSLGDFVLNGGEAAAVACIEAVARLIPGFMGHQDSGEEESFTQGLLEYPHYTRPEEYRGARVPEVLRSGDHGRIAAWRREQAVERTLERRPDMLPAARLDGADVALLRGKIRRRRGRNLSVALVHYPVLDKYKKVGATSLTNLDVHDIARCSRTYGLDRFYAVTPLADQRDMFAGLVAHWRTGPGAAANPDRAEALSLVELAEDLDAAVEQASARWGRRPRLVATSARLPAKPKAWHPSLATFPDVADWLDEEPVLLVLGTGYGLARSVLERCDAMLRPIRCFSGYNHLSVRSAAAIMLDRLVGDIY